MKRIARWSTIFLLLCSIIWAGTASAAMIVNNNMAALHTLNTLNKAQMPLNEHSALERLAKEIGAGMWDNTDWDDPAFQANIGKFGITVLKKDTQPPESFIGDAIFDHLGDTEFNAPEMNGNLLVLGGLNANLPSGKIDRLYVLSDEDVRLNIGAAAEVQELILGASGDVSLNGEGNVRSTIVVDKPMNLDIGIATNLVNLTDAPLPTGDIVLNPGKNALVPGQQLHMGSELKVEKKISLTVRFRLVDQSAKDMQLETADWDGALLTETTVQYTGDSCPMGAVNMMDSIEAAFAEKYPDLQEQYVLPPSYRQASHAPCVWASSESASARRNFGRVLNTGTTTLMRTFGKRCARCAASSRLDAFSRWNRHSSRSSTRAASISPARCSVYPAPCIRTYARTRSAHCTRVPPADFPALIIPCAAGFVKHRAIFCQFGTIFAKPLDKRPKKC